MTDRFRIDGRVAVVTGVLGNLGPVWAQALLEAGATVIGQDLADARMNGEFERLQARYADALTLVAGDVTDRAALCAARDTVLSRYAVPTVLVNNAGIDAPPAAKGGGYRLEEIPADVNRRIFEVNTLGLFQVMQVFGGEMAKVRRGSIINIGSLYASVSPDPRFYDHIETDPPFIKPPAYGATKAAVVNLTKYLATAWGPRGVPWR